jgi:hypothetical protein
MVHLQPTLEYWTLEGSGAINQPEVTIIERGLRR